MKKSTIQKKIKVIYDISLLGGSINNSLIKTGIHRVVKEISHRLANDKNIDLYLYTSTLNIKKCIKYLKTDNILSKKQLLEPKLNVLKQLFGFCISFCQYIKNIKLLERTKEKLLAKAYNVDFSEFDVYFSPVHKIPKNITDSNIKTCIINYDIIPVIEKLQFTRPKHCKKYWFDLFNTMNPDLIFTISENTKRDLLNYRPSLKSKLINVIPLGTSEEFYPCNDIKKIEFVNNKYKIPKNAKYILSLCTLEPRKNLNFAIKGFIKLLQENPKISDLYLVIAGQKGWLYEKIFTEINNAKEYKDKIIFTEFVDDEDMSPLYSGATCFVYPSLYEGFGLPPLEAMKCGVPVITSNTSSLPEVVGDAGIMIDPTDEKALTNAYYDLYSDKKLAEDLSKKSIERAKLFTWEKACDIIVETLKQTMI